MAKSLGASFIKVSRHHFPSLVIEATWHFTKEVYLICLMIAVSVVVSKIAVPELGFAGWMEL